MQEIFKASDKKNLSKLVYLQGGPIQLDPKLVNTLEHGMNISSHVCLREIHVSRATRIYSNGPSKYSLSNFHLCPHLLIHTIPRHCPSLCWRAAVRYKPSKTKSFRLERMERASNDCKSLHAVMVSSAAALSAGRTVLYWKTPAKDRCWRGTLGGEFR